MEIALLLIFVFVVQKNFVGSLCTATGPLDMASERNLETNSTCVQELKSNDDEGVDHDYEDLEIICPDENESETIPDRVEFQTKLFYTESLLKNFDGDHDKCKDWITNIFGLARLRMQLLNVTKVDLKNTGEIKYVEGLSSIRADNKSLDTIRKKIKPTTHHVYFVSDPKDHEYVGYSYEGAGCDKSGFAISIVGFQEDGYGNSETLTANTLAHELGHSLGMKHDDHEDHGGKNTTCQGIMSELMYRDKKWSSCSNQDFKKFYKRSGHKCLKQVQKESEKLVPVAESCVRRRR